MENLPSNINTKISLDNSQTHTFESNY